MRSEWWDGPFSHTYEMFTSIFTRIMGCIVLVRLALGSTSHPEYFQYPQRELLLLPMASVFVLIKAKSCAISVKQICLYCAIELVNFLLKLLSITSFETEVKLLIIQSTVLTILFQAKIFESTYLNALIIVKHITLWYFYDYFTGQLTYLKPNVVVMFLAAFSLWIMFEITTRSYLKETFLAKEAVKKTNTQIVELLRLFSDGLLIIDRQFKVKYTNDTMNTILPMQTNDYSSKLREIIINDSEQCIAFELKRLKWENNNASISIGVASINDSLYEWTAKIVNWEDELCYMITVKDVTKILIFERMESENRSKTELIRSVSHELRTPINAILLIVEDLLISIQDTSREKLSMLATCVELLNYQISDILDYSELVSGNFTINSTHCNLKVALEKCARLINVQTLHKGLDLITKIDESIPDLCIADEFRVQKVVMNLLSNAAKYTSKGAIELCAINTGSEIEISVKDTGIGIHQERLDMIFEMFSENNGGVNSGMSGLGLHISNNILKLSETCIEVTSKIGEGSRFSFSLDALIDKPRFELSREIEIPCELEQRKSIPLSVTSYFSNENPKILIADDNDFNRLVLGRILKAQGIMFVEAVNGEEAVNIISEFDKKKHPIKCIIMDCNMPVMDGWEATKRIVTKYTQGILKHLPIIIGHTAYSSREDIQRCYDCGMVSYFLKPTSREQFLAIIRNHI